MPPLIEIYGTCGYARLGYDAEVFEGRGDQRVRQISGQGVDIWQDVIRNFADFVAGRGEASARFEDGFAALATAEAAYRSIQIGKWIEPAVVAELVP